MTFPDDFATERLRAERLTPEHLPVLRRIHTDPKFMAELGGVRDEAHTAAYLERNLRHWAEHGFGTWILRDAARRVAGLAVLRHLPFDGADEVELGYGFYSEFWGRGLATEIGAACLGFGRQRLALPSIVALTRASNVGSQRVLTKLGFAREREVELEGAANLLFRAHGAGITT